MRGGRPRGMGAASAAAPPGGEAAVNVCKALCELTGVRVPWNSNPYGRGLRRCRRCDMFFKTTARSCPCCGTMLRVGPRSRSGSGGSGGRGIPR